MYTKLDTRPGSGTGTRTAEESETIRQDNCACACNSATEVPDESDRIIIAKNMMATQLKVHAVVGDG